MLTNPVGKTQKNLKESSSYEQTLYTKVLLFIKVSL